MQYLLHIDTSTDIGIVALAGDGRLLASRVNQESRNHASTINNMIADVLAEAGINIKDISAVAVCAGPGSYTGLRIGMATAKGICYALDKPLILDDRLSLLAMQAAKKHVGTYTQYASLIVAREKEYFITIYNNELSCILPPQHVMEDQLGDIINKKEKTHITTNAPAEAVNHLDISVLSVNTDINIDLNSWMFHAYEKYVCNNIVKLSDAEPFYLKQVYTHK